MPFGDHVREGGEGPRATRVVARARQVGRAAGGDLDDAIRSGLGKPAQRRVEGLRRGDVDR